MYSAFFWLPASCPNLFLPSSYTTLYLWQLLQLLFCAPYKMGYDLGNFIFKLRIACCVICPWPLHLWFPFSIICPWLFRLGCGLILTLVSSLGTLATHLVACWPVLLSNLLLTYFTLMYLQPMQSVKSVAAATRLPFITPWLTVNFQSGFIIRTTQEKLCYDCYRSGKFNVSLS